MTDAASDTLGNYFRVCKEKGKPGLPTLSVTMNDGLVDRSDLDRKMETNLSPEQHLSVLEGDIAYNMMRMWQGAFGRADKDGIVSPAYVVVNLIEIARAHGRLMLVEFVKQTSLSEPAADGRELILQQVGLGRAA